MISAGEYGKHYKIAVKHYRNDEDAMDAFHTVMVKCLPHRERVGELGWHAFLMTALINYMRNPRKKKILNISNVAVDGVYTNLGYNSYEVSNLLSMLTKRLTSVQKKFFLRYLEDPSRGTNSRRGSIHEMAEEYNTTHDNVHAIISLARIKIKEAYGRHT